MEYPSLKRIVCKLYDKVLISSSFALRGPSHGRRGSIDEAVRPPEPIIVHVRCGQVDPDQRRRGAYARARQQNRRQRISPQVGISLLYEPGRNAGDLGPGLGHGQWYVGGPRERISYSCHAGLGVRLAVSVEDSPVGLRVGTGEGCDPVPQGIRLVRQLGGVGELVCGEAGGHACQPCGEGDGYGGHGAPAWGWTIGGHAVEKFS
jgi:hypothetical protein